MAFRDMGRVLITRDGHDNPSSKPLSHHCGLLFTCRKIYAETCRLPFELSTIIINENSVSWKLRRLQGLQCYAIATVQVYRSTLARGYPSLNLSLLPGLTRVIVLGGPDDWTGSCGPFSSGRSGNLKGAMTRWLKVDAQKEDLTVQFVNGV
jgi:hypothetical protein